jgi:hypothetical protein
LVAISSVSRASPVSEADHPEASKDAALAIAALLRVS